MGIYLGKIEVGDIDAALWDELRETWDNEWNEYDDTDFDDMYKKLLNNEYSAYLFKCPQCEKHYIYLLENN